MDDSCQTTRPDEGAASDDGAMRSPNERRVVALQLRRDGDRSVLEVRSCGTRGEFVREVRAPAMTATHAACAVARHYGLVRLDSDHWALARRSDS